MADQSVEVKQEPVDESNTGDSGKFRGSNRQDGRGGRGSRGRGGGGGGGGSRFSSGRGGENQSRDGDNNSQNSDQMRGDFRRGRGRGRGGFRGGRDGQGRQNDDQGDGEMDYRSRGPVDRIQDKLNSFNGPTHELPPLDMREKKFNGRNRLYVGNLGNDTTEEDLTELFKAYGETSELFVNKDKNFGFIKIDYRSNVDKAKRELDGHVLKGRNLKIRLAPNSATIKVKNLTPYVTNELLYYAFSPFGDIEKAHVMVDERGRPTGEGYIHFARKYSAATAIKKCQDGCFFLTASPQPVIVEPFELVDDTDGFSDKHLPKKNPEFLKERDAPPRMAYPGSFEYEYAQKFKVLHELHKQKEEALKKELELETEKITAQMEYARFEHETEMLRNQLRAREMGIERQKREWELKERRVEEERLRQEEMLKRHESRMMASQEDITRRQQETSLFIQAHQLDSLLEQQEQVYDQSNSFSGGDNKAVDDIRDRSGAGGDGESEGFTSSYERQSQGSRFDRSGGGGGGHWVSENRENRRDDYDASQNKRRRF